MKNTMMLLIERDIIATISMDSIVNNFKDFKKYTELLFYKLLHILYCVKKQWFCIFLFVDNLLILNGYLFEVS